MPAKKLRRRRREYGVEDEAGNTLIDPSATTKNAARAAAARLAAGRSDSVYVFEVGEDSDGTHIVVDREEIRPPAESPKSRAQIKREIDEILARKPNGALAPRWEDSPHSSIAKEQPSSDASSLRIGQRFDHFGHTYEIIKIGRDKNRTIQIARRHRDPFGKEAFIDHRSFPARHFEQQHLKLIT